MKGVDFGTEIQAIKKEWGERLLILGHHYQRSNVLRHADEQGDSLELARKAAGYADAERIVFCGVRFMAESADILTGPDQAVFMPEMSAGCPMADMADEAAMRKAWADLTADVDDWLPVVYVNSTVQIKACCGEWGGSACTSSNAATIFKWVFDQKKRVFFLPDEHLGANTAHDLGVPDDQVAVYDPAQDGGGLDEEAKARAKVIVWKGFCLVHAAFTTQQVADVRERMPHAGIIVHPEAPKEVVRAADAHGSTSQIIEYVEAAKPGSEIVVGTELNLVERLTVRNRGRLTIKTLLPSVCANMARTNESSLLALLNAWPKRNEVHVSKGVAEDARKSLETMLSL